jgi:hypothetical protein
VDGSISKIPLFDEQDGRIYIPLHIEAYGSVFIVFSDKTEEIPYVISIEKDGQPIFPLNILDKIDISYNHNNEMVFSSAIKGRYVLTFSNGKIMEINCKNDAGHQVLSGGWDVYFPDGWGFDPIRKFDSLLDWTRHPDTELSIFSGIATYKKTFKIKADDMEKDRSWILDLGLVGEVVRVYLNGQEVITSVFPPYHIDIGNFLRAGENHLVIEVANTWLNQLIGEKDKPFDEQRTRSNVGRGSKEKAIRLWSDYEPQPSGLIGPVRIIKKQNIKVKFQ